MEGDYGNMRVVPSIIVDEGGPIRHSCYLVAVIPPVLGFARKDVPRHDACIVRGIHS